MQIFTHGILSVLPYFDPMRSKKILTKCVFQFFLISTLRLFTLFFNFFAFSSSLFRQAEKDENARVKTFQFFLISTFSLTREFWLGPLSVLPYFDEKRSEACNYVFSFSSSLFRLFFYAFLWEKWLSVLPYFDETQLKRRVYTKSFQFFLISTKQQGMKVETKLLSVLPYFDKYLELKAISLLPFSSSLFRP